ncbi:uncharacterized protein LOC143856953 [Tasmannia lanceolata]|uniref:uncharacterized protein LOC143856953 n=1 Tax=Tasmannia lanceolata TaxID=3420 RepID=UPI004063C51D
MSDGSGPFKVDDMFVGAQEIEADTLKFDQLTIDAMFYDMRHFKKVVREYAIRQKFIFKKAKSSCKKYFVRCKEDGCKWRITGVNHMTFVVVKSLVADHTCTAKIRSNDHPLITTAWAAETCLRLFARLEDVRIRIIREYIKMHWVITISYWKAYNAMNIILEIKSGNVEDSYHILPAFAVEIMGRNPASYMLVVETENEDSWEWFLKLLKRHVLPDQMNVFTICSDKQKGLLQAVPTIFPNCYHSYCMHPLAANFRSDVKDLPLERLFLRAARTLRESVFKETIEKIKDARKLLIASLVEHTQHQTTQFIQKRQKLGSSWHTKLTHYAEERLESSLRESCQYTAYRVETHEFEVKSLETTDSVDLITRMCSCRAFQTYGLPCRHAITTINITEFDPYDYCDECFDAKTYRDTYAEVVSETLDRTQWHESPKPLITILPPLAKRLPPRTRRTDRELKSGFHYKCTQCRQLGHNRRSCKEPPVVRSNLDETAIGPSAPILTRSDVPCQAPFFA